MNQHILIIDDELNIRELLAEFLSTKGYRVTHVGAAGEARRVVQADPPELIISDLQLEDSDGLELVANLKTMLPDVPVILLTGILFDPPVVADLLGGKVSGYIAKTATLAEILVEVRRLLPEQ